MSLPSEWAIVRLKEIVVDIQSGFAQRPSEDEGSTPQIRTHNVSPDGHIDLAGIKYVTPSENELERYSLNPQDIIFNNTNSEEWVGKTALFKLGGIYVFSNHMTRIRVNSQLVEPEYLARYLHFLWRAGYYRQRAKRWVSQAAIDQSALSEFKIALPTIPEQQRIVAILRQADELRRLRREILEQVQKLPLALFIETFGDPISNPKGYRKVALGKLGQLDRGISKHRPRDAPFLYGGDYPFVQTGDVTNSGGWITDYIQTYSEAGLAQSRSWPKGTLCITIAANIARTGILTFDACFPDSVVGFLPGPEVTTEYVMYAINLLQHQLESQAPQAAQKNINLQVLRTLQIPRPDFGAQKEFSNRVDHVRQYLLDSQESKKNLDRSFDALQTDSFSGDFTVVWRASHRRELEAAAHSRDAALGRAAGEATVLELPPIERAWLSQPDRDWLLNQLSKEQGAVLEAMRKWHGILIAAEELDEFRVQCFSNGSLDNTNAYILRTLDQLAGLGLVVKVSVPNQQGEYVTGYRGLREDELSHIADRQSLAET